MNPTLLCCSARASIHARIDRLSSGSDPVSGTMSAGRMTSWTVASAPALAFAQLIVPDSWNSKYVAKSNGRALRTSVTGRTTRKSL